MPCKNGSGIHRLRRIQNDLWCCSQQLVGLLGPIKGITGSVVKIRLYTVVSMSLWKNRMKKIIVGFGCLALVFAFLPSSEAQELSWSTVFSIIESRFPETPTIEIDEAIEWQQNGNLIFVDVRSDEEFLVSHLMGAKNWTKSADFQNVEKSTRMVLYCSVGYRSAKLVQELQTLGYTEVYNLKGSIFAWANSGKPLFLFEKKQTIVHPYDRVWGRLLEKKYHPKN